MTDFLSVKLGRPENVAVEAISKESVMVTWEPPLNSSQLEVTKYVIQMKNVLSKEWEDVRRGNGNSLEYQKESLTSGETYQFRIFGKNRIRKGEVSQIVNVTLPG